MKGLFQRTWSAFEPVDDNAKKIFKRYKLGDTVELEHKAKRNIKFHKKYFAMLNLTFQNQDITDDSKLFRKLVTIAAGYYHWIELIDGTKQKEANSISFDSMDDLEFQDYYNDTFNICLKILGCKSEELELELLKFD